MFEYFVSDFVNCFGDFTKDYVCSVFDLLSVGYDFMEDGEGSMCPLTSPESVLVVFL